MHRRKSTQSCILSTLTLAAAGAVLSTAAAESPPRTLAFNIPTDLSASPLFGAAAFTQGVPLFEEFGLQALGSESGPANQLLPSPSQCSSGPDGTALDAFLSTSTLFPLPTVSSNDSRPSAWDAKVKECVPGVTTTAGEGRPPGEYFSHQRWSEFAPQVFFQTAMTGARINLGLRDRLQRHRYSLGEFAPGGLYYNGGSTRGTAIRLHPNMPVQDPNAVWTFDGTLPPKLLMARYGESILFRHHNALPIDASANGGFGEHTITTHEHNGHNPAESDGYAHAYFYPGQYYDYRWPMVLAGHDSINTKASEIRAGAPDGAGGIRKIRGDWRETMSTHWFHDHMLDFTAQNVYKGNAAMMNYYSAVDRGREPRSQSEASSGSTGYGCHYANSKFANLCLPSGSNLDWGNRDYDVNLLIADKAWDANGQLAFNIFNTDGFLGDQVTVNWAWKPYLEVRARRYRFRLLNGSVSRDFRIALIDRRGRRVPFHLVANDGNLMEHAVAFPNAQSSDLPPQGVGERYDIVVDFSKFVEGDRLYFVNLMEHADGKGPKEAILLEDVLNGRYLGDPAVGKFLEFRVRALPSGVKDLSMNPADYVAGKKKMLPLPPITSTELANARQRTFEFGRSNGTDDRPWTIKTDGGPGLSADPHRLTAAPTKGSLEIWHLLNGGGGWAHPVHVHFEEARVLLRGGKSPPVWEQWARKDVFRIGSLPESGDSVDIALRFREFAGSYVEHCHNTQHEDHAMLLRWDVENPGQTVAIPTPMPGWEGVVYEETFVLPGARPGGLQ